MSRETVVRTPAIDRLYGESARLTRFYTAPVCAPTRASLMTGRYHYRTGVVDTFLGRSMMYPDETTLPELLGDAGYRTGVFGKWHLGDNHPFRPVDRGIDESLVHRAGGIGQPGDFPDNGYVDPELVHNGERERYEGYCTDIFTSAAIDFVEAGGEPFYAYLATNRPHTPLCVSDEYADPYREQGLDDSLAPLYGTLELVDDAVDRLLSALSERGVADDTVVVFTADHGPQRVGNGPPRYNAGRRGHIGQVYEGNIRIPCFVRWSGRIDPDSAIDDPTHAVDLLPTVLDLAGGDLPERTVDGESLAPVLLNGTGGPDRYLYTQWDRVDEPRLYRNCAVIDGRYKLVDGIRLYDLERDPGEQVDVAARHPDVVERLRKAYEAWFAEMRVERGFEPPRIRIGTPHESPTLLTRQDWRGPERDGWDDDVGYWLVEVATTDRYAITLRFPALDQGGTVHLRCGDVDRRRRVAAGEDRHTFDAVSLRRGPRTLEGWVETGDGKLGARYVDVDIDR